MNIAIASIFRNSSAYIETYFGQARELAHELIARGHTPRFILAHGDSTDRTPELIERLKWSLPCDCLVFEASHGGREFGSVDVQERWTQIAFVWNQVLDRLREDDDLFILVESDLVWEPSTILQVQSRVKDERHGCTCMVWLNGQFYDTWGHRKNGRCFTATPPYHEALGMDVTSVDSAGSLWVVKAKYAREARFTDDLGIVGWCNGMRALGANLSIDPQASITHPPHDTLKPR